MAKVLGKGLKALIKSHNSEENERYLLGQISIDKIKVNNIESEGSTSVPAHTLYNVIKELPDDSPIDLSYEQNNKKLHFENLTLAPIEKDLINYNLLNKIEKDYLFRYNLSVYSALSKFLNRKERQWLASFI